MNGLMPLRIMGYRKINKGVLLRFLFEGKIIKWLKLQDALDDYPDLQDYHLDHTDE